MRDPNGRFPGYVVDEEWNFTSIDFPGATHTRALGINAHLLAGAGSAARSDVSVVRGEALTPSTIV